MKPKRLQRLLTIVDKALALEPEERVEYLNEVCGKDTVLRGEVGELLESIVASESFWEGWNQWNEKQIAELFQGDGKPETEQRIGPWKLLRRLGRGGMGTVWLAERTDGSYEQQVALKLLHRGMETGESAHRFKQERQILARLNHPQIARLYDGGHTDDGLPWLAMEYIDGLPVTRWCDQQKCTLKQRIALFEEICGAIRYAHRNLIVHRDLKPENILVTNQGHIKILDFGIAKLLDEELPPEERIRTRTGLRAMSLDYAAPEQITGEPITTATDVYALGLLLYELLTGGYPYELEGKNLRQIEQIIRTEVPVRPSAFQKEGKPSASRQELRGDLDAITLKSLRKEPDDRYENAGQFLEDLHHFQRNQPVEARQGTVQYRVGKWIRRHRWTAASGFIVVLSLVLGTGVALWQARQADQAAQQATIALAETEQALSRAEALQEFLLDLFRSAEPDRPRDQLPTTEEILALGAERALDEESAPPAERFSMLLNIGRIYRQQNWNEQARPLLEAAVELAREHREERPEDLALALWQFSVLLTGIQELDQADRLLQEAESLVKDDEAYRQTFVKVRTERGWVEYRKANFAEVIKLSEPLYQQIRDQNDISEATKQILLNNLVSAFAELGKLPGASKYATQMIELTRNSESMGPESDSYAIALNNSVHLEYYLGRFEVALDRSRKAVSLIEQIEDSDQPSAVRAAMRSRLAHALLYAGHFDEALDKAETANIERAQFQGVPPDESEVRYYFSGYFLVMMHRWEEAEQALNKARNLFFEPGKEDLWSILSVVESLLAKTFCHQDRQEQGETVLADLEARQQGHYPDQPLYRALIHEARAACYFKAGSMEQALTEVDTALTLEANYPGRVMHQADRRILRARILVALSRHEEAEKELNQAEQAFLDLDLADHPHFSHIKTARRELFGNGEI